MGKNKKKTNKAADSNDPDALKVRLLNFCCLQLAFWQDLGNQEYAKGNYEQAIELYTKAIDIQHHEIYFSNRKHTQILTRVGAQVFITIKEYASAVQDCDKAIAINHEWTKAYTRKAMALAEMTDVEGSDEQALAVLYQALKAAHKQPDDNKELIQSIEENIRM